MQIPRIPCEQCGGTGHYAGKTCAKCGGEGYYIPSSKNPESGPAHGEQESMTTPETTTYR